MVIKNKIAANNQDIIATVPDKRNIYNIFVSFLNPSMVIYQLNKTVLYRWIGSGNIVTPKMSNKLISIAREISVNSSHLKVA